MDYHVYLGGKMKFIDKQDLSLSQREILRNIFDCFDISKPLNSGISQWKYATDTTNTIVKIQIIGDINVLEEEFLRLLSKIPKIFPSLVDFFLDNNQITTIPPTFNNLHHLIRLGIVGHNLSSLPDDFFSEMPHLTHLSFHQTKLSKLPTSFYSLSQLEDFYWQNTPPFPADSIEMKQIMPRLLSLQSDVPGKQILGQQRINEFYRLRDIKKVDALIEKLKTNVDALTPGEMVHIMIHATFAHRQYLESLLPEDHTLLRKLSNRHSIPLDNDHIILQ